MKVRGDGPIPTRVMLVGEAPGENEEREGRPFVGASGQELNRMLHEAGIMRSECYTTNVCKVRPPNNQISAFVAGTKKAITAAHVLMRDRYVTQEVVEGYKELLAEIEMVQPNIIVAFGNLAMWALTGNWAILKWRGSQLQTADGIQVIPTIHPAAVLREWSLRAAVLSDLRRVKRHLGGRSYSNRPEWNFTVRPSFEQATSWLKGLFSDCEHLANPVWLDFDIETRGRGHVYIDCIGLSYSRQDAICIPFMRRGSAAGYWTEEEEARIVWLLYKLLTHPNVRVRWHNGLYDAQIVYHNWHFIPRGGQDTMISQHSLFAALPKALGYVASIYADWYVYWKDEGKVASDAPEEQRWKYNLQDCIYTREVGETLRLAAETMGLAEVDARQQALFEPVLRAMLRGVRIIPEAKAQMALDIQEELSHRETFLYRVLGHTINPSSPKQMQTLFYEDLKQRPIMKRTIVDGRTVMRPTCDDEALQQIAAREPLLKPLCNCIADIRTLNKFFGDFVMMPLDLDGRMRCSFNIAGDAGGKSAPYSYRLSSSKNPFGSGGNLQTIPSEKSKSAGKAAARGSMDFRLPNIRSMYGPDPGFTFFDMDLDRADLQVVSWEADDPLLKAACKMGADVHLLNVYTLDKHEPPPLDELVETHPRYWDHREPRKHKREFSKVFCHACITGDHEVLTPEGWITVATIKDDQDIAVWNIENQVIAFERPQAWNRDAAVAGETLVEFEGQAYSQLVTADHRMPYTTDKAWRVTSASDLLSKTAARLPKSGYYSGQLEDEFIELIVAYIADGSIDQHGNVYFHFHKERKKKRLKNLLTMLEYSEYPDRFYIPYREAKHFTKYGKAFGRWVLDLHRNTLDRLLQELEYWDGTRGTTGAVTVSSLDRESLEWLRTVAHLRGKASQYQGTTVSGFGSICHRISLNNRPAATLKSMKVNAYELTQDTPVFCPKTTTGFFLVRRQGKISVTGNTNYIGSARTVAAHTGRSVHEIDAAQKYWFSAHPGIKRWHDRVAEQIAKRRFVENRFGYRWYIFDRLEGLLPEAVAWIPQSTVGCVINRVWTAFHTELPEVQVLLQVHDSLAGQFPTHRREYLLPRMRDASRITIPYDDPLIIPTGIKTSTVSWGECA